MILRPYQERAMQELRQAIREGHRRILVVSPTGSGKGVILSNVLRATDAKGNYSLFLVHRREIIEQASIHLKKWDINHGMIMAGKPMSAMSRTQLASVNTLFSRSIKRGKIKPPTAHVVITDEAHHVGAMSYLKILDHYKDSISIGFTATPVRKTGYGLGDYYTKMISVATVKELTEQGYLAPATYMAPSVPDLSELKVKAGDYIEGQVNELMDTPKLVGSIVGHFQEYAQNRKAIVFASGVLHSRHLQNQFRMAGISCAHVDGSTPRDERDQIMADFKEGKYQVITNCDVFTEGVDTPDVDCIILARPTKSLALYLQMAGRGLRPADGKKDCLIIDHAGNVYQHGPVDMEHEWSLSTTEKIQDLDARKPRKKEDKKYTCNNCGTIFSQQPFCPACGEYLEKGSKPAPILGGELAVVSRDEIVKKRRSIENRNSTKDDKRRYWMECLAKCAHNGAKVGAAAHMYRAKFGVYPTSRAVGELNIPHGKEEWNMPAKQFRNFVR